MEHKIARQKYQGNPTKRQERLPLSQASMYLILQPAVRTAKIHAKYGQSLDMLSVLARLANYLSEVAVTSPYWSSRPVGLRAAFDRVSPSAPRYPHR